MHLVVFINLGPHAIFKMILTKLTFVYLNLTKPEYVSGNRNEESSIAK